LSPSLEAWFSELYPIKLYSASPKAEEEGIEKIHGVQVGGSGPTKQ
jgi:hypothetical protein